MERSNRGLPESGILFAGVDSKTLMDKLWGSSKDIVKLAGKDCQSVIALQRLMIERYHSDSFSAVHRIFSPSESDAQSKAIELLQEIEGRFPINMHKVRLLLRVSILEVTLTTFLFFLGRSNILGSHPRRRMEG